MEEIRSACSPAEQRFFITTCDRLSPTSRERFDALLDRSLEAETNEEDRDASQVSILIPIARFVWI
ncbi:hypothetical protein EPA93_14665 [Ktedonosporobacter rubrisoli]|uniref:Uncharacterized protein n=1 Tax=Ktedonosporobacter rubrisoli TaxID=2509675 RepID=A0A4P6JPM6_KTERU|nr:hypothetical protein [Ktedonosporobacter rubrisoli]QBD77173.1 hypothetical protein EPA93_14665 [Ktedonosporobacter rubrisoli]